MMVDMPQENRVAAFMGEVGLRRSAFDNGYILKLSLGYGIANFHQPLRIDIGAEDAPG